VDVVSGFVDTVGQVGYNSGVILVVWEDIDVSRVSLYLHNIVCS